MAASSGKMYTIEFIDNIAIVRFNARLNLMNLNFVTQYIEALNEVERHEKARGAVFTSDSSVFCAGLDLGWIAEQAEKGRLDQISALTKANHELYLKLLTFPMPTIAALNGPAIAGGALLALAHDLRVMVKDKGYIWVNEVNLGIPLIDVSRELLRLKLPVHVYHEAVILGQRLDGKLAMSLRVVSELGEKENLVKMGMNIVRELTQLRPVPRKSMREFKTNLCKDFIQLKEQTDYTTTQERADFFINAWKKIKKPESRL